MSTTQPDKRLRPRQRLSRHERYRQLVDVAWRLVRQDGTDALTLGRLAEHAGVTKPVVYDHFGTRHGLLATLYREFDERQTAIIHEAIDGSEATLEDRARVLARSYVDCVLAQGREIPDVIAALRGSPELEEVKRECEAVLLEKCRKVLAPFASNNSISSVGLRAMLGAAEALSFAASTEEITASQAEAELFATIVDMVARQGKCDVYSSK